MNQTGGRLDTDDFLIEESNPNERIHPPSQHCPYICTEYLFMNPAIQYISPPFEIIRSYIEGNWIIHTQITALDIVAAL